jgi:excinuclease ABC subunit A
MEDLKVPKLCRQNIHDILTMTIDDAVAFFETDQQHKITQKLKPLQDVGLGYSLVGQSSSTLSDLGHKVSFFP